MTLDEAIEALELKAEQFIFQLDQDTFAAMKLIIEAAKQLRSIRQAHPEFRSFLLQGESTE